MGDDDNGERLEELTRLIEQVRKRFKAIDKVNGYFESEDWGRDDYDAVFTRMELMEKKWKDYTSAKDELEFSEFYTEEDNEIISKEMDRHEQMYISIKSKLVKKTRELGKDIPNEQQQAQPVVVQLPSNQQEITNTWGEFDGGLMKWRGFSDRFKAAIHENTNVKPAFKFQYLQRSLIGKAKRTLGEWQYTDANYTEAWERLEQVYNRPYATCQEYLRQFYRLPFLERATADGLQRLVNGTHEMIRQLRAMELPVDTWDMIIIYALHERLDLDTSKDWELERQTESPKLIDMLEFLERRARAASQSQSNRNVRERYDAPNTSASGGAIPKTTSKDRKSKTTSDRKPTNCRICQKPHQLFECQAFKELSINGRKDYINRISGCENCLKNGHDKKDCFQHGCPRCNGDLHNSLLCPALAKAKATTTVRSTSRKRTSSSSSG